MGPFVWAILAYRHSTFHYLLTIHILFLYSTNGRALVRVYCHLFHLPHLPAFVRVWPRCYTAAAPPLPLHYTHYTTLPYLTVTPAPGARDTSVLRLNGYLTTYLPEPFQPVTCGSICSLRLDVTVCRYGWFCHNILRLILRRS